MSAETDAINGVIDAWESLPGGGHTPREVAVWLRDRMKPAMDQARSVVGRTPPGVNHHFLLGLEHHSE